MLSTDMMIPLAVFLSITLGTWVALGAVAGRPQKAEDRLRRLLDGTAGREAAEAGAARKQEMFQARVTAAARKLGQSLRPSDEAEVGKVRLKLLNAGYRHEQAVTIFFGLKALGLLIGLAIAVPAAVMHAGMTQAALSMSIAGGAIGFYLPEFVVVVCVEAGLGLDAAMRRVTGELANASPELCEEFAIVNFQLQMGRPRKDVLRDLGTRTGVEDVRALAAVIIQAERFGTSIGSALRVQSDAMRLRRRQLAEERAAKTAVKIMIPLILFIFPGVFVVLVGPAGIQMYEMMIKKP